VTTLYRVTEAPKPIVPATVPVQPPSGIVAPTITTAVSPQIYKPAITPRVPSPVPVTTSPTLLYFQKPGTVWGSSGGAVRPVVIATQGGGVITDNGDGTNSYVIVESSDGGTAGHRVARVDGNGTTTYVTPHIPDNSLSP
jgi:hypothetical protein